MARVVSIILGGGKGTRLFPLTKDRAKPAVPFGAKFRLVDIPISNCINAGFKQIYVLTQFNSASLHVHIGQTYIFDGFSRGFVEILAAEQTFESDSWYEGTADAVRKNFHHFRNQSPEHYLILSGDQLYRMDLGDLVRHHAESGADMTVACTPVSKAQTGGFGIVRSDPAGKITEFLEKPSPERDISRFKLPSELFAPPDQLDGRCKEYIASMGIYVFRAQALEDALHDSTLLDFGKEIIPKTIANMKAYAYVFNGFWEDIGTIRSFYETNLNLASVNPSFNFYDETNPIYTHKRNLPPSKFNFSHISETLTGDGCIITNSNISRSIVGIRSIIESGSLLDGVVCLGADYYESPLDKKSNAKQHIPDIGIGKNCAIKGAIIDKNARIGEGARIGVDRIERPDGDYDFHHIRDGVIVIPKNGIVPMGAVI
jgi:glucose-1-phosphate adenylyltransferase